MRNCLEKICVIGGGNIGTYLAVTAKRKGYAVSFIVSDPSRFSSKLSVMENDSDILYSEQIDVITSDFAFAMESVDVVFITYPSFLFEELNKKLLPFIKPGVKLFFLPGTGGCEFQFSECIFKGAQLFGLQRVPGVFRLEEYGKKVKLSGKRDKLFIGSLNAKDEEILSFNRFVIDFFEIPCEVLPNYLCITLTPSNPILHTTRLYSMFKDYSEGEFYDRNMLFYEEWTVESSKFLIECDAELQKLCREIEKYGLDLKTVRSLKEHYAVGDEISMTSKIRSISSFKGLTSPMKQTENGWIPDFSSRYFSADFPYGLKIILDIAKCFSVPAKKIEIIWNWYVSLNLPNNECFELNMSKEEFLRKYLFIRS